MTDTPGLTHILAANRRAAGSLDLPDGAAPGRALAVITCMDRRIDVPGALGLELGDAHVIRNAGGRVSDDALRSLIVSAGALGVREVGVIPHTTCGMATPEPALRQRIEEASGGDASGLELLAIDDLDETVAADVDRVLRCPLLPADLVAWGAVYDVTDGRLRVVVEPSPRIT